MVIRKGFCAAVVLGVGSVLLSCGGSAPTPEEFLAKAAAEPGAVRTPSGLVFRTLSPGQGGSPTATDTVRVHYAGTLTDGSEFDSSIKRGEPTEFRLDQVIPCWTEGVQRMKVGEKARLVCPAGIAYGVQGRPPVIPGNATLVFEVELLGIR
jgi:FKBP-type peptidyl-prolyl cis-trans isomerase FkpA